MSSTVSRWSVGPSTVVRITKISEDVAQTAVTSDVSPNGGPMKRRWECKQCDKSLSSKRSYDEHMNIHNNARPFQCPECSYAAASQMTLRRHRLRSHVARQNWGYRCPYCTECFMEPASYQSHVGTRHPNRSCTFGCPVCKWTCRSARFFKEHVEKHIVTNVFMHNDLEEIKENELQKFLVDDDFGVGFRYLSTKDPPTRSLKRSGGFLSQITRKEAADYLKEPLRLPKGSEEKLAGWRPKNVLSKPLPVRSIIIPPPPPIQLLPGDTEWIETEVTIEDTNAKTYGHVYDDGCVDNLDLD
ncbi:unnamed protein product, partial [Mesorhabditis spiculigera]